MKKIITTKIATNKINTVLKVDNKYCDVINCDNFHNIYYRGDINKKNVLTLTRIIMDQNNKYAKFSINTLNKYPMKLHITSIGGSCEMGLFAHDVLSKSRFPIHTFCEGNVCSSGTLLYLAGKERYMTQHSQILIHQLSSTISGTYVNLSDSMYNNTLIMKNVEQIYLKNTNIDAGTLKDLMKKDIFLTSEQCLKLGFAHTII